MRGKLKLYPIFRIRLGNPLVCELLLDGSRVALPSFKYVSYLSLFDADKCYRVEACELYATMIFECTRSEARAIVEQLVAWDVLVPAGREFAEESGIDHWVERNWTDALVFHLSTRNVDFLDMKSDRPDKTRNQQLDAFLQRDPIPDFRKSILDSIETVRLPVASEQWPPEPIENILLRRRSHRKWKNESIPLGALSDILRWSTERVLELRSSVESNFQRDPTKLLQSAFCALEMYVVAHAVEGIRSGIFHYDLYHHRLECLREGNFRQQVQEMCIGQRRAGEGVCSVIISCVWERFMYRYRHSRAYQSLLMNTAELGNKVILAATSKNMSTFHDTSICRRRRMCVAWG